MNCGDMNAGISGEGGIPPLRGRLLARPRKDLDLLPTRPGDPCLDGRLSWFAVVLEHEPPCLPGLVPPELYHRAHVTLEENAIADLWFHGCLLHLGTAWGPADLSPNTL